MCRFYLQAYNLSKDHKPELEVERDRILKAGGFIQVGRINGTLNLTRAIGTFKFPSYPETEMGKMSVPFCFFPSDSLSCKLCCFRGCRVQAE